MKKETKHVGLSVLFILWLLLPNQQKQQKTFLKKLPFRGFKH